MIIRDNEQHVCVECVTTKRLDRFQLNFAIRSSWEHLDRKTIYPERVFIFENESHQNQKKVERTYYCYCT